MALPCNNLNLNLYRVFYTVAKTKSFSESSRTLHISQPAISKHIQNLEYELNTLLFYRTNRGIELTPEAKSLLVYVERAWNFLMIGEKQLQESKELTRGKVSIGLPTYISTFFVSDVVKQFMSLHPNIVIKMANHGNEKLFSLMNQHSLDLLVVPKSQDIPQGLQEVPIDKEEYCFCYAKNYPEHVNVKTLEDLVKLPLLLPVKTTEARKNIDEFFNNKGLSLDPIMELEGHEMMMHYIKEGFGIGYVLRKTIVFEENIEIIKLEEDLPCELITLLYNETTLTNSSKEFIKLLTKQN